MAMEQAGHVEHVHYLEMAVRLARDNAALRGGRPFGAVLVRDGGVVATGVNEIVETHDPSAHAEVQAIRAASALWRSPRLEGCVMYASGHPCPMCLALMHMTGFVAVYYAYSNEEAEPFGLSTAAVYEQMARPSSGRDLPAVHLPVHEVGEPLYELWRRLAQRPGAEGGEVTEER